MILFVATVALGSRPRQRGCKVASQQKEGSLWVKAKAMQGCGPRGSSGVTSHTPGSARKCEGVWGSEHSHSQGSSHFGRWSSGGLPKLTPDGLLKWSPDGLPKLHRAIWGVKTQWIVTFFISLESSWNVDAKNGVALLIQTSETQVMAKRRGPGVELPIRLPTRKSRESTRFICLQTTCDIPLERSWRELQPCFRPHFDRRSVRKVIRLQSRKSPSWRDFETQSRESRERKAIWM